MSEWEHLPKAPITEALIDIRVELPSKASVDTLRPFCDEVRIEYPQSRERRKGHAEFTFGKPGQTAITVEPEHPDGYVLTSVDGTQIVQVRLDGFTFSRLKPYKTWDHLHQAARPLWARYCDLASPTSVTRIAVRYINRLELPLPVESFKDWLTTTPEIAPALPQGMSGFFLRLNIPFAEPRGFANVTLAIEPGDYTGYVPVIFDIDAFLPGPFYPKDDAMWDRFTNLRAIKNEVFFNSLTPRTVEMYR